MADKTLLLLIQSNNVDTYVNTITHCVKHEGVKKIFFVGKEVPAGQEAELEESIKMIYARLSELVYTHSAYRSAQQYLPPDDDIRKNILRIDFVRPHQSIPKLRKKFSDTNKVLVDITAASKQLAGDITTSFMTCGFSHVCHFVLSDKVYSDDWGKSGKKRLYHDLIDDEGVIRYTYSDFSKSESTMSSFNKLRARGKLIRILLAVSILFALSVVILLAGQKTSMAQIAAITTLITVIAGLLESVIGFSKSLGKLFKGK